jgi:phosphopantothenoylcysteine decarboxylase/phosphopantothenate--cysteine ligase
VRYISNHSSGKMGFAIARAAVDAGALTTLISGPVALATPDGVQRVDVTSAQEMYDASIAQLQQCDIFIGCAAVADYRPAHSAQQKIKKNADTMHVELVRNPDIISAVATHPERPFTVGFAAETQNLESYALAKLENKKLDMIVANDVSGSEGGFNSEQNSATILWPGGKTEVKLTAKQQLARILVETIAARCQPQ